MNLNKFIYKNSVIYFVVFSLIALFAFWPRYFSRLFIAMDAETHFHGIIMTLWCVMLIAQGWLIRIKKYPIHKIIGKLSYGLAPLIVISGIIIAQFSLQKMQVHNGSYYSSIALMFNSLIAFSVLYSLAIYHLKSPLLHARFMLSTLFPMFTPLTDRIIYNHFRPIVAWVPTIEGRPMVWLYGFALANLILVGLIIWDWKTKKHRNAFITVLGIMVFYHISVISFHHFALWRTMGDWIMSLPFS